MLIMGYFEVTELGLRFRYSDTIQYFRLFMGVNPTTPMLLLGAN